MQEKYIRVLGTSLLSYGLFIEQLVLCEGNKKMKALEKAGNMHSNILKDPKFWKLAHHNNLTVRKSFHCVEYAKILLLYCLLCTVVEYFTKSLENEAKSDFERK